MKLFPSFNQWSKGKVCLTQSTSLTFVFLLMCGIVLPMDSQAQVWVEDLVIRKAQLEDGSSESDKLLQMASTAPKSTLDLEEKDSSLSQQILQSEKGELEIRNFQGKIIWQKRGISLFDFTQQMPKLDNGLYFVQYRTASGVEQKTLSVRNE